MVRASRLCRRQSKSSTDQKHFETRSQMHAGDNDQALVQSQHRLQMNRLMTLFWITVASLFGACTKPPVASDVVGTWVNPDGAAITLNPSGEFSARSLPKAAFWQSGPTLETQGVWTFKRGAVHWEVELRFGEALGRPLAKSITVLVSGSGPSTYLFGWVDEPGGNRYTLKRRHQND